MYKPEAAHSVQGDEEERGTFAACIGSEPVMRTLAAKDRNSTDCHA